MKKKAFALFAGALLLVLIALAVIFFGDGPVHERDFRMEHTGNIGRIEMKKPGEESVVLEKTVEGNWLLNENFHVNRSAVRDLLSTLRNQAVRLPVPMAEQAMVNRLLDEQGVKVNIYERSHWIRLPGNIHFLDRLTNTKSFYVGENTPDGESTYMRKEGADIPFAVHLPGVTGGLKDVYLVKEHVWRDPVVVDLAPDEVDRIEMTFMEDPAESFVLQNHIAEGFVLKTPEGVTLSKYQINQARAERFLNSFSGLRYERLAIDEEEQRMKDLKMDQPFLSVKIAGITGQEISLGFFRREPLPGDPMGLSAAHGYDPNRFYLQVNEGDFALAQYYVFNRIMRPLSFFLENFDQ